MSINYSWALERFKQKQFPEVVSTGGAFLEDHRGRIAASDELIKLGDITLRAALMLGDRARTDRLLDVCGNLGVLSHFRAATDLQDGDIEAAWFSLANATPYNPDHHGFWSLGLNSVVRNPDWLRYAERGCTFRSPATEAVVGGARSSPRYAVVFSSDSGYFKRFFEQGIASLRRNCSHFRAYYYVIEPDEECVRLMHMHAAEDVEFLIDAEPQRRGDKSYFATTRFFAADRVVRETGLPAFIFDIDSCVLADLATLLSSAEWPRGKTVCRFMGGLALPWHKIVANAMYVPPTREGRQYLEAVCAYLRYVYSRSSRERLWWLDQNALYFAFLARQQGDFANFPGWAMNRYVHYPRMFEDKDKVMAGREGRAG